MKRLIRFICAAFIGLAALSCYDDSELRESIKNHEDRLVALETLARNLNSDIKSLKTLIEAIEDSDYIISVTPVVEDRVEVGYEIKFAKSGTITIYHGADGEDGKDATGSTSVPVIGVQKGADGVYYWTIDGEYLLDSEGNPVPASGADGADGDKGETGAEGPQGPSGSAGADGVTPQLKIEEGYWYVSYDDGTSWTRLGKATGEDGKDGVNGGDGLFKDVYEEDGYVCFVLSDGTVYKVPMAGSPELSAGLDIIFDVEQGLPLYPEADTKVNYTISGGEGEILVRAISLDDNLTVCVYPETSDSGHLLLCLHSTETEFNASILVSVSDGKNSSTIKTLNIEGGVISSALSAYLASPAAGIVTAQVTTNLDYDVVIPSDQTWLTYVPDTKALLRTDEVSFRVEANDCEHFRYSHVYLVNNAGLVIETFMIVQRSISSGNEMEFADSSVKKACVDAFDADNDGVLTYAEVVAVTDLNALELPQGSTSFDELQYFYSVREIPDGFFADCTELKSVILPEFLQVVGNNAFYNCRSLKSVSFPESLKSIGDYAFSRSGIEDNDVDIDGSKFTALVIPESVCHIGNGAFVDCPWLDAVMMASETPFPCESAFRFNTKVYVPDGCYEAYRDAWGIDINWADIDNRDSIYPMFKDHIPYSDYYYSWFSYEECYFFMSELRGDNATLSGVTTAPMYAAVTYADEHYQMYDSYFWFVSYEIIFRANVNIRSMKEGESMETDHMLGENYCIRALCHLNLLTLYAVSYSRGSNQPGIVIRTSTDCTSTERATVAESYEQVITDLKEAMRLMKNGTRRGDAGYVSYETARGLLTRVYLYMGKWDECIALAEDMLGSDPLANLDDISGYFADARNSEETLWCIAKSIDDIEMNYKATIASMYYDGGMGWCELYWSDPMMELMFRHPEDERLAYFSTADNTDDGLKMIHWPVPDNTTKHRCNSLQYSVDFDMEASENVIRYQNADYVVKRTTERNGYPEYYIEDLFPDVSDDDDGFLGPRQTKVYVRDNMNSREVRQTFPRYMMSKFSYQDNHPMLSSPALIRWAEVILNLAEAYAHRGDAANALKYVNVIRTRAGIPVWTGASHYESEGYADILDLVLDERRLELCFEGHRAFDLYRNGKSIDRRFSGVHDWEVLTPADLDVKYPYIIPVE